MMFTKMNIPDSIDDTWEDFFGATTDLMPSIMGAIDAIWEGTKENSDSEDNEKSRSNTPKRSIQANSFANLSPNVQKILSNVPDEELNKNFSSEESIGFKKFISSDKRTYSKRISPVQKSNESIEIISQNVQKMLSNLPDGELVNKNSSFLHNKCENISSKVLRSSKSFCSSRVSTFLNRNEFSSSVSVNENLSANNASDSTFNDSISPKPLGSYLHTSPSGIASRTPVGRKNLGKYLQVPSESSVGTNSTASSEVSRPVSLTSLGSCSSSSSGGHHQPCSAYLASAESLDSDPEPTGSQGSADSGIAEQPTMSPEQCVLQEVMDTETVYVSDLREVIEGYLVPWKTDSSCPLLQHLEDLFNNLEEIYRFNRSFLEELQQANCNPTLTANAFLHNDAGFSVYTEYCTNYPRTMFVLSELTGDENMATLFREKQLALGHALPLGSYLLKPVQRILKYHLLLQRLSKQCEQPHKPAVDLALATMTSVASHINTMKRKHEHAVRVQEIQSQLYGWSGPDLTALGELIAEGTFRVGGARGRRHIFLFDKVLLIAKSKQDGWLAYKSHIMCSNLMLVEQVRGEPLSFHIIPFDNPRQQCTLRARSSQHKREWTLQLKRVILENYSAVIPNHARQLVMQLGQNLQEEDASDKWSPLKQHSTPQYLERRGRFRKTNHFAGRRSASQDRSFSSLTSWRRKSEPGIINQFNSKTLPKKITKLKKTKEETAKFYTDLSDSETCDVVDESNDSLNVKSIDLPDKCEDIQESSLEGEASLTSTTLEKVVSDLLMQNAEFHKLLNRQRKNIRESSEPCSGVWSKQENKELPSKADSLPRDFQLNDQLNFKESFKKITCDDSLLRGKQPDVDLEDLQESDLSSQLNDSEHPDHRIYRKSAIRFSLVQRFRAIISEEQKRTNKLPTYKQGSESMGAKIANPDYADPQKLFRSSQSISQLDLQTDENCEENDYAVLDLSINETEVLNSGDLKGREFEMSRNQSLDDIQENGTAEKSSQVENIHSSQNSDGNYEEVMEKSLNEDSFNQTPKLTSPKPIIPIKVEKIDNKKNQNIKRPNKAPPPIPTKPLRLSNGKSESFKEIEKKIIESNVKRKVFPSKSVYEESNENEVKASDAQLFNEVQTKGWVKTIVGRFE